MGYNNIHIKDGDQHKAAFKTKYGLFEPNVMHVLWTHKLPSHIPSMIVMISDLAIFNFLFTFRLLYDVASEVSPTWLTPVYL